MALTKPILTSPIPAFDATLAHTFTFSVVGGDIPVSSRLIIKTNGTESEEVYNEVQAFTLGGKYEHTIPADTLVNGKNYNVTVQTVDNAGNESTASSTVQFWVYSTPTIQFTNLPYGNLIRSAAYSFEIEYNQDEGEALNAYRFNLYNSAGTLVSTSGDLYTGDGTPTWTGAYLFAGFDDSATYSIECIGTTINFTTITTGRINLTTQYTRPDLFTLMRLENNCDGGYILVSSNIVTINGESNPEEPTYIAGKEIDLREDGSYAAWNEGYTVSGDMTARLWFRDPTNYAQIFQMSNTSGQTIKVYFKTGYESVNTTDELAYCEIVVESVDGLEYVILTNFIDILSASEQYNLWISRIDDIYSATLYKVE